MAPLGVFASLDLTHAGTVEEMITTWEHNAEIKRPIFLPCYQYVSPDISVCFVSVIAQSNTRACNAVGADITASAAKSQAQTAEIFITVSISHALFAPYLSDGETEKRGRTRRPRVEEEEEKEEDAVV